MNQAKKKNKNVTGVIVAVFMVLIWGILFISKKLNLARLEHDFELTSGYIDDFGFNGATTVIPPSYKYKVGDKFYDGYFTDKRFCRKFSKNQLRPLQKKKIPVVYWKEDYSVSVILLKKSDYLKYKIEYSDELQEVLGKYFDCE